MSKKPSKAKRSRAKPARIPRDPVTGQQLLFDPTTGEPTRRYRRHKPTPAEIKADRAHRLASRKRHEARRGAFRARLGRRPVEMQGDGYTLPDETAAFLRRFHDDRLEWHDQREHVPMIAAREMIEAAYMAGCRQGYIEGFVVRREIDRQRSRAGNAAKRNAVVTVGTSKMPRQQRDAVMVGEYDVLLKLMKPTPACQRLADKYGFESWQGVAAAIKRFRQRAGG